MLNLREAAEQAGTSKTSIFRAIKSGRLSATRDDQGGVQIDPAELARAFPPKPLRPERSSNETPEQGVMPTERVTGAERGFGGGGPPAPSNAGRHERRAG